MQVSYGTPFLAGAVTGDTTITTTEADLLEITDEKPLSNSQFSIYLDVALGSATEVKFRYYVSPDKGTTWLELPVKDLSTGILSSVPTVVDSTSPTSDGQIRTVEDIPVSATTAFKITGQSVGANATLKKLHVFSRVN